jgi:RNA polymerase sigma-70 factor, ECF subfamily
MSLGKLLTLPGMEGAAPRTAVTDNPHLDHVMQAAIRGDAQAAHTLVVRVLPRVRNLIRYLVRGDDVDDLTQDALIKVLERLPSFRGEGRFESWVDGVTMRVTLRSVSRQRADVRRHQNAPIDEVASPSCDRPSPRYLARRRAVEALDQLPNAQRVALVMHHVLGMTVAEIAGEIETPAETVRSRLRVGMGQLRALLGALGDTSHE